MTDFTRATIQTPGSAADIEIAPLALGGNVFGWTADRDTSFEVLDGFIAGGGDFIDTADSYSRWVPGNNGGESETIIGQWLAARRNREGVAIATKVFSHPEYQGLAPANVRAAVDASLTRLGTDHIDLYYAHHDDPDVPLEEVAAVFSSLVDAGKIRAIGLSNFTAERVRTWLSIAAVNGLHAPVALQPHYNLLERGFETDGQRDAALEHDLAVFPYYALASGFLAGKYRDEADAQAAGASPRATGAAKYLDVRGRATLAVLDEIASAHSVEVATVALAWLRQQPSVAAPIASARTVEQLPALLASMRFELAESELAALTTASG